METNPTANIDLNFDHYLKVRERELTSHLIAGIPDYGFSLDQKLRQQLVTIKPVRALAKALVSLEVPIEKQIHQMESIAVGPRQYPEIYKIGQDCAHRLGIGVPQIFVARQPVGDAYTIATDDIAPIIVISTHLIATLTPEELTFVIGHECGHIHNLHGIYNTAVEIMTNPLAQIILEHLPIPTKGILQPIITGGINMFFKRWSRCAEITCDRAGMICCGNLETAQFALAKLVTGGGKNLQQINLEEYMQQIKKGQSLPMRLIEFFSTHPLIPKRIEALSLFNECEIFYSWRKELIFNNPRSKEETDKLCEQVIRILPES
jgi:Zn-dependent protease with chaperone function